MIKVTKKSVGRKDLEVLAHLSRGAAITILCGLWEVLGDVFMGSQGGGGSLQAFGVPFKVAAGDSGPAGLVFHAEGVAAGPGRRSGRSATQSQASQGFSITGQWNGELQARGWRTVSSVGPRSGRATGRCGAGPRACPDLPSAVLAAGEAAGLIPAERCVALLAGVRDSQLVTRPSFFQLKNVRDARRTGLCGCR